MSGRDRTAGLTSLIALAASLAAVPLEPANAADTPAPGSIIDRACASRQGQVIDRVRLGEALIIEAGGFPSELVTDLTGGNPPLSHGEAVIRRLGEIQDYERTHDAPHPMDPERLLLSAMSLVQAELQNSRSEEGAPLRLAGNPSGPSWLFLPATAGFTLTCKTGDPDPDYVSATEKSSPPPAFAIRSTPEELSLRGKAGRKAGAFTLGFERSRTKLDDGTSKTDTSFSINGTVGARLSSATSQRTTSYLYGRYELQRARTRPAPALAVGASEGDGDTNVLEVGGLLDTELLGNRSEFKLFLNAQLAGLFDFANDASRAKFRAILTPAYDHPLGICGFGSYKSLGKSGKLMARCGLQFEAESARVLRQGRTQLGTFDSYFALGGRATYELFMPTDGESGLIGTATYRLLPILHGPNGEIERFEASLKHRFWTSAKVGIDVGFSYTKGTNELSFEEEDVLKFGLGIIY